MKYLKKYVEHNEGLKSAVAGIGLATSLLMGSPNLKASNVEPTTQISQMDGTSVDSNKFRNMVSTLSELRASNCQDKELSSILDDIKSNVNSSDTAKVSEMFSKLSSHLEREYGYKIGVQKIDRNDGAKAEAMKDKPSELNFFMIMGWLGSVCLALCGVPQAIQSYKDKHSHGISWGMLLLWAFGEVFALAYVFNKLDMPLLMNYSINIFVIALMLYYKIYPTSSEDEVDGENSTEALA